MREKIFRCPYLSLAALAAGGALLAAPAHAQDLSALTGESQRPLQITGFGVGDYTYDARTRDNSFSASTIAVSLFKEVTDQLWFFGQLTTAEDGTEIDNFIASWTPAGAFQAGGKIGSGSRAGSRSPVGRSMPRIAPGAR